jgi:hypothetical protein
MSALWFAGDQPRQFSTSGRNTIRFIGNDPLPDFSDTGNLFPDNNLPAMIFGQVVMETNVV